MIHKYFFGGEPMNKFFLLFAAALLVSGCQTATTSQQTDVDGGGAKAVKPIVEVQEKPQPMVIENRVDLTFIDISGFDEDLSMGMSGNNREIIVDLPGKMSLNDVPGRLDQWFAEIKSAGGKVQAKPISKNNATLTRGIVGMLIDIGVKAHKAYAQKQMLQAAQNYNVVLEYDKASGIVERAVFVHRQ